MNEPINLSVDWKNLFDAKAYLKTYYDVGMPFTADERANAREIAAFVKGKHFRKAIEVGAGPTIHHAISIAPCTDRLILADYVPNSLKEIQNWMEEKEEAHNWDAYIENCLLEEDISPITEQQIITRKKVLGQKIQLTEIDLNQEHPLMDGGREEHSFDLVTSFYCADSATGSKEEWKNFMRNIFKLLAPDGHLLFTALDSVSNYAVGSNRFPSAKVNREDIETLLLESGFAPGNIHLKRIFVPELKEEGFDHIIFGTARL